MRSKIILLVLLLIAAKGYCDSEITIGGATGQAVIYQNEGVSLRPRPYLNFVGSMINCADSGGKLVCTLTTPATPDAGDIVVDTTNFDNVLSGSDTTVQSALETLDDNPMLCPDGITGDYCLQYDTTDSVFKLYANNALQAQWPIEATYYYLLLESGHYILNEDGGKIILY